MTVIERFWTVGILRHFLAGLFVILPLAITISVISWVVEKLKSVLGPGSTVGDLLSRWGATLLPGDRAELAFWLGTVLVLVGIWLLGTLFELSAKHKIDDLVHAMLNRIPVFNAVYRPVSQVVKLLKGERAQDMKGMEVVFCRLGGDDGVRVLGLLTSHTTYPLTDVEHVLVYVPTSPVPMSGYLIFVPGDCITPVPEMSVDDLAKIYLSLGVLTPQVIPERYRAPE